jgi:hypothetical protein
VEGGVVERVICKDSPADDLIAHCRLSATYEAVGGGSGDIKNLEVTATRQRGKVVLDFDAGEKRHPLLPQGDKAIVVLPPNEARQFRGL